MAFVKANGITIHARVEGRHGAPRLAFLNSLGSDLRIWDEVVGCLRNRFEILLFDMRGHGLSTVPDGTTSIPQLAGDFLALMDALGWERATLVGLSIGGLIAQHVAIHAAGRVGSLVLLDTAPRIGSVDSWAERIEAVRHGGLAAIAGTVLRGWVSERFVAEHPERLRAWQSMLEATPVEGYVAACAALSAADHTDLVQRIVAPTLVVVGDQDRSTPPAAAQAMTDRIPGAGFAVIAGAGHLPCLERPAELAALIAGHCSVRAAAPAREGAPPDRYRDGMTVRRAVLGDAHVDRAVAATGGFDAAFQRFITEGAWGSVWARPHFTPRERSIVTLALLAALGQDDEVAMHVRATRNTGASADDIAEAFLHVAVYAGVPAANHAIKIAKTVLADMEASRPEMETTTQ